MRKLLNLFRTPRVPFKRNVKMDALLARYYEINAIGVGISLDRNGFFPEQIEEYDQTKTEFLHQYGTKLLDYLEPYRNVTRDELKDGVDYVYLWGTFQSLARDMEGKKAETN